MLAASAQAADTRIDSGPSGLTNDPTFYFSSPDDPPATFQCSVDSSLPATCNSPNTLTGLADGPHTFVVQAVDSTTLLPDPTPASRSFTFDTIAPTTTIDTGPNGPTNDPTPTFTFSSSEAGSTFQCKVDSDPFGPCSGPGNSDTETALSDGPHSFRVRATDLASNTGPNSPPRTFTVDTNPPNTTIVSGPTGTTSDNTPTFSFFSGETPANFECKVDSDTFAPCSGPNDSDTTGVLSDGPHTFKVRAIDSASNADPSPASQAFTVDTAGPPDTTAPDLTITKRPGSKVKTQKEKAGVKVSFTSEAGATYACKLDKAKYKPCTSPYKVKAKSKVGRGQKHRISIRATDEAGNIGKTVVVQFRVLRAQRLRAPVAQRTVVRALERHGFARRVVRSVHVDCSRGSRTAFRCKFSVGFAGYHLKGKGLVKLGVGLSYRFRVKAQGVRLILTDDNEAPHKP